MASLSLLTLFKSDELNCPVDLFTLLDNTTTTAGQSGKQISNGPTKHQSHLEKAAFSVVIDSESCLDRLYGGYYSDWASGGQWNRMLTYIGNLSRACHLNQFHVTVAIRGGVEKQHANELFDRNSEFKERLTRVMMHLQNRGTPPPKVWWLPPTCLREVLCLALQFHGELLTHLLCFLILCDLICILVCS